MIVTNKFLLVVVVLILASINVRGQSHEFGLEIGTGSNLNFNREIENYGDNQVLFTRNWSGLKYYFEAHYSLTPKFRASFGVARSTVRVGNSHSTSSYRFHRLYLRPTYQVLDGEHFSLDLSLLGGRIFHNYNKYEESIWAQSYINGNYIGYTQSSYSLLPERPQNIWFVGSEVGLNYSFGNRRSSISLRLGASTGTELLVRQHTARYDVNHGSDYIVVENWGEMMYLTLGYRLTLDLSKKKD